MRETSTELSKALLVCFLRDLVLIDISMNQLMQTNTLFYADIASLQISIQNRCRAVRFGRTLMAAIFIVWKWFAPHLKAMSLFYKTKLQNSPSFTVQSLSEIGFSQKLVYELTKFDMLTYYNVLARFG